MNTLNITKQLIKIPSYVDKKNNEKQLGLWIYKYLSQFSWIKIKKQFIGKNRFNLIASDDFEPKLIFVCHMDTVQPSTDPKLMLNPKVKNGKLYGLGSADMKAGIAALLYSVKKIGSTQGLTMIFDCDEEYYFKGIKKILSEYSFKPKLVICPENTQLKVIRGCRGLIEISFDVIGKTAHASRPQTGINSIEESVRLINLLKKQVTKNDLKNLGNSTINLSYLKGGIDDNGNTKIQANAVPNLAKLLLDIRTANPSLTAKKILSQFKKLAKQNNLQIKNQLIKLDYQSYLINKSKLKSLENALQKILGKTSYLENLSNCGFYETALISSAWKVPAISFGPIGVSHSIGESVDIQSLNFTQKIYQDLITNICS